MPWKSSLGAWENRPSTVVWPTFLNEDTSYLSLSVPVFIFWHPWKNMILRIYHFFMIRNAWPKWRGKARLFMDILCLEYAFSGISCLWFLGTGHIISDSLFIPLLPKDSKLPFNTGDFLQNADLQKLQASHWAIPVCYNIIDLVSANLLLYLI